MITGETTNGRITLEADRANRIYIAGPMTGLPELNFPAFHAQAGELRDLGWHVENPAEHGVVERAEWGDYLRYDIGRLASCEAVWLLPGWSTSKGAQLELHIALALGMTVIGSLGDQANKGSRSDAIPAPAKATLLAPTGLEELAQKWENRSREAAPTDAMVINLHIRELRETLAPTQIAAEAPLDERVAFEAKFEVPGGTAWNGTRYVVDDEYMFSYWCERFLGQWEAWQARAALSAPQGAPEAAAPSPTAGMNIAQRILHVGGRNNAAGYVEFGSIQAVKALVLQVLRDLPAQSTHVACTQAPAAVAAPLEFTDDHVGYISRYGGNCRDCADENGTCPSSGLPCAGQIKAIRHVLNALSYGINNGFLPHSAAIATQEGGAHDV